MKTTIFKICTVVLVAAVMTGCSLFKFSIDTGENPLSVADAKTRLITRGFYYEMSDVIVRTADSIASSSDNITYRINAIKWKMQATRAAADAAMQSVPDVALLDTWLLCRRMEMAFENTPDDKLFGRQTEMARHTAKGLDTKIERLAKSLLPADLFTLMSEFVALQVKVSATASDNIRSDNTMLAWVDFLNSKGQTTSYTIGSISEVVADIGDRFGAQTQQITNGVGWSKDIFELRLQQDSIRDRLAMQLDSLENDFNRIAIVMENIPQISDAVTASFAKQVDALIGSMNRSVDNAFADIDRQRSELQKFISEEREAIVRQTRDAANDAVQRALDAVPSLIGKVLFYIILFVVVIVGGPFALGLWVGRLRERRAAKKRGSE